jgi:hypothetical protein
MRSIKANNPVLRYAGVVAARYLCLPAVIENVLIGLNHTGLDQFEIAERLGVVIPEEGSIPHITNYARSSDSFRLGVSPDSEVLNYFFAEHGIPLCCGYHHHTLYEDWMFEAFVVKAHGKGEPVIFCFDYSLFSGQQGRRFGHSVQLLELQEEYGRVTMSVYDPGPETHGVKTVTAQDMYHAIKRITGGWLHFTILSGEYPPLGRR